MFLQHTLSVIAKQHGQELFNFARTQGSVCCMDSLLFQLSNLVSGIYICENNFFII